MPRTWKLGGPGLEGEKREGEQTKRYLEARDQVGAWREELHALPPAIFSLHFTLLTVTLATAPQTEEAVTIATCSGASHQLPPSPPHNHLTHLQSIKTKQNDSKTMTTGMGLLWPERSEKGLELASLVFQLPFFPDAKGSLNSHHPTNDSFWRDA